MQGFECAGWVFECAGWVLSALNRFQNGVYITPTLRALAGVIFPVTDALQGKKSAQLKLSSCGKLLMQMCACATRMKIVEALTTTITKSRRHAKIEGVGLQP